MDDPQDDASSPTICNSFKEKNLQEEENSLNKMWFPWFDDPEVEAVYVKTTVSPLVMKSWCRAWVLGTVMWFCAYWHVLLDIVVARMASKNVPWCVAIATLFLFVQTPILCRYVHCVQQDTLASLWALMTFLMTAPVNGWRLGMLVAGDGRYFDYNVDNDEYLLILWSAGLMSCFYFSPLRSLHATFVFFPAPLYLIISLPHGWSPTGQTANKAFMLLVMSCSLWSSRWRDDIRSRMLWFRSRRRSLELHTLSDEVAIRHKRSFSRRKKVDLESLRKQLSEAVQEGDENATTRVSSALKEHWSVKEIADAVKHEEKTQSEDGGISMAYLLSEEFQLLAQEKSQKSNPTFYEFKDAFFLSSDPIGKDIKCPRDGELGCSFLDALPRKYRRRCSHFLSRTWAYHVQMFRACLAEWIARQQRTPSAVFLFCCFLVNNQHRILVQQSTNGSDNLEEIFEKRLARIGTMVAMLDEWKEPLYLSRIWTIFEQACAVKLRIPVTMLLPPSASSSLIAKLETGRKGIEEVQRYLQCIDSEHAQAFRLEDELRVKTHIQNTLGFRSVNKAVAQSMATWIGKVVHSHFDQLTGMKDDATVDSSQHAKSIIRALI